MKTNILRFISNFVKNPIYKIGEYYKSRTRINAVGDALELFVKDLFCDTAGVDEESKKIERYQSYFSYLGNQNNPPDIMIREGDAIEVKKIEGENSQIALNSSYPKNKIYANSKMITDQCRSCEDWAEKDIIYVIGSVNKANNLRYLWLVHGNCYAAGSEVYEKIKNVISQGINEIQDVEFAETNEIGRVNKVDPLGITYLRIRGMRGIENPNKVFQYIDNSIHDGFYMKVILTKEKFESFPDSDKKSILELHNDGKLSLKDIKIKSPNNPAELIEAKIMIFYPPEI